MTSFFPIRFSRFVTRTTQKTWHAKKTQLRFGFLLATTAFSLHDAVAGTGDGVASGKGKGSPVAKSDVEDGFQISSRDWPWWRGPLRNGHTSEPQKLPVEWSESKNVLWKTPIPGRGYGSVCVHGEQVFLLTSEEETGAQYLIGLDRTTGKQNFKTTIHAQGGMRKNSKSTAASSTPATDGEHVFMTFANQDAVWLTATNMTGKIAWQKKISDYVEHQGYGASPALYRNLVIVSSDNKKGGVIAGLDRKTGEFVWKRERPELPNYPSPILIHSAGKDQVIMTGCDLVTSLDPLTGDTLWETAGATTECVTSTVTDGKHVYTSGGYPRNHMSAILADGSKKLVWQNDNRLYVPSPLVFEGTLFGVLDAGIAMAWDSQTGKELWKHRLGGTFSASPVMVNDHQLGNLIFATNEAGETYIFSAASQEYKAIGKNKLGREVFATPVMVDNSMFYRCTQEGDGPRQEFLYCIRGE